MVPAGRAGVDRLPGVSREATKTVIALRLLGAWQLEAIRGALLVIRPQICLWRE